MTKLYVSRYSNKELGKTNAPKVGISLGKPKFPVCYEIKGPAYLLAPSREIFGITDERYFTKRYKENLDKIGIEQVKRVLSKFGYGTEPEMILLCFEDITKCDSWCHRTAFAEWWKEQTGEDVLEYPDYTTEACKRAEKEAKEKEKAEREAEIKAAESAQLKLF